MLQGVRSSEKEGEMTGSILVRWKGFNTQILYLLGKKEGKLRQKEGRQDPAKNRDLFPGFILKKGVAIFGVRQLGHTNLLFVMMADRACRLGERFIGTPIL